MPSYFVPKKNRCPNGGCPSVALGMLNFATSSSYNTSVVGNKTVYTNNIAGKDNTVKQGSGGNSYAAYLARKKGGCDCA